MVGSVENLTDFRNAGANRLLDAVLERDVGHAAVGMSDPVRHFLIGWKRHSGGVSYAQENDGSLAYKSEQGFTQGTGIRALDVSTFFQRRSLDREFEKLWRGPSNHPCRAFQRSLDKFIKTLTA